MRLYDKELEYYDKELEYKTYFYRTDADVTDADAICREAVAMILDEDSGKESSSFPRKIRMELFDESIERGHLIRYFEGEEKD